MKQVEELENSLTNLQNYVTLLESKIKFYKTFSYIGISVGIGAIVTSAIVLYLK
jgi:hypothetical protein